MYGDDYVPDAPRRYERKVKNAQEAHEAIRPAGETFRTPERVGAELSGDELALYRLVWERTVASQMTDATGHERAAAPGLRGCSTVVAAGQEAEFSASGRVITFPGFLRAYVEGEDDPEAELADRQVLLPPLSEGDVVEGTAFEPGSHSTQPPARYTEASLVKALEELGVGRPSTYASVIATILDRGYVWKKGSALVPSFTAFAVVGLLERYFANLVDYGFTATMEDDLDEIAAGTEEVLPWLTRFYFGRGALGASAGSDVEEGEALGLKATVAAHLAEIDAREINSIPLGLADDGEPIVVRVGRYGPYLQHGERRASIPDDLAPDELTVERAEEILAAPSNDRVLGVDPETRPRGAGQGGPFRSLRPGGRGGRRREAADGVAVLVHGPGHAHPGAGAGPAAHPAHRGRGPGNGRGGRGAQRPVRAVRQARHRHAQPDRRGPAAHRDPRRGPRAVRPAQATPRTGRPRPAARARRRPDHRPPGGVEGGTLRPLRDRRHDQRQPAPGRHGRGHRHRTGVRAAGRAPGRRAVDAQEEGGRCEEGAGQEDVAAKKAAGAKKAPAKKASAAKKSVAGSKKAAAKKTSAATKTHPADPF